VIGIVVTASSIGGGGRSGFASPSQGFRLLVAAMSHGVAAPPCKPLKRNGNGCNNVRQGFDSQSSRSA
jgi:hypothetical protein